MDENAALEKDCHELDRRHARHVRERKRLEELIAEQDELLAVESSDEEDDGDDDDDNTPPEDD